jgi:phosphoglycerate dehydrogenase-like enzyme
MVARDPSVLSDVSVVFSSWGMPRLDEALLNAAPRLAMIFYGAGSVRGFMTEAAWRRGVRVTSAYAANGIPVAEYTVASMVFALKRAWDQARHTRERRAFARHPDVPGFYEATIGLVSLGMIGRTVAERLKAFDARVLAHDPFLTETEAAALGVRLVALDELFRTADVVSLHTPSLPETQGMIGGALIASMKPGATLINTARGAVIREAEMIAVLRKRPDIFAVLDVTHPEPPPLDSPLYDLPNVFLTPHIAGSVGRECRRLGRYMVEELDRWLTGEPLRWEITREHAARMA